MQSGHTVKGKSESRSVKSDSLRPHGLYNPWNSPGRNTGVGSLSLLQGIFPTQGSNPGLLRCRRILYQLNHNGDPTAHDQKNNQPSRKTGKYLNGHFSKEDTQMSIKHMKRCSGPLSRKCQSNCHQVSLTPLRRAILQKVYQDEMLRRAGNTGTPPTLQAGVEMSGCGHNRKQCGDSTRSGKPWS